MLMTLKVTTEGPMHQPIYQDKLCERVGGKIRVAPLPSESLGVGLFRVSSSREEQVAFNHPVWVQFPTNPPL